MKLEDLLMINCEVDSQGVEKLKKAVTKTKWLEKYEPDEIDIDLLEKVYKKVSNKYDVKIGYIQMANGISWGFMLKLNTHEWLNTVYSVSILEGMMKTILVFYGYIVKGMQFELKKK